MCGASNYMRRMRVVVTFERQQDDDDDDAVDDDQAIGIVEEAACLRLQFGYEKTVDEREKGQTETVTWRQHSLDRDNILMQLRKVIFTTPLTLYDIDPVRKMFTCPFYIFYR